MTIDLPKWRHVAAPQFVPMLVGDGRAFDDARMGEGPHRLNAIAPIGCGSFESAHQDNPPVAKIALA